MMVLRIISPLAFDHPQGPSHSMPESTRQKVLASLSPEQAEQIRWDWRFWARPNQFPPPGDEWRTWLILAGRGWGKTRVASEWVRSVVCGSTPLAAGNARLIALV